MAEELTITDRCVEMLNPFPEVGTDGFVTSFEFGVIL